MRPVYKLGRLPHDPAKVARCLQAHDVLNLSTLPSRPAARDWSQKDGVNTIYQMFGNDYLSDCVIASLLDEFLTWARQTGAAFNPTLQDALDGYQKFGGWDPNNSAATDNGCVMLDVVTAVQKQQLAGQTVRGFVHVDPKNLDLMGQARDPRSPVVARHGRAHHVGRAQALRPRGGACVLLRGLRARVGRALGRADLGTVPGGSRRAEARRPHDGRWLVEKQILRYSGPLVSRRAGPFLLGLIF